MHLDDLTIDRATRADLDASWSVIQRSYRGEAAASSWSHQGELPTGERVSRDVLSGLVQDRRRIFSVARLSDRIVGTSLVEPVAPEACTIGLLSVDPDFQGQGVGDRLLRRAERDARDCLGARLGIVEVLDYKPLLIAYYQRREYRATGQRRRYPHRLDRPAELLTFAKSFD